MKKKFSLNILKKHSEFFCSLHRLSDPSMSVFVIIALSYYNHIFFTQIDLLMLGVVFLLVRFIFEGYHLYRSWRGNSILLEIRSVLAAWAMVLVLMLIANYFTQSSILFEQDFFMTWAVVIPIVMVTGRICLRFILRWMRSKGYNVRKVVIAGAGNLGCKVFDKIHESPGFGMEIVGFFDDKFDKGLTEVEGFPVLGNLASLHEYAEKSDISIVYIALPHRAEKAMRMLTDSLQDTMLSVFVIPDIFVFQLLHTQVEDLDGVPLLAIFETPKGIDGWLKRSLDIAFSSLIIVLISPLLISIACIIKFTSPGPVIFRQRRYGLYGKEVYVYKFRTMSVCEDGKTIKQASKTDKRITPFGSFLRRTSLDELPQFFNVLRGTMSVVGPRPHAVAHNEYYRKIIRGYMLRHRVKPGITGWAQVNGWRGETETIEKMEKRVDYDLEYIRNWSIWLDIKIIIMTVFNGFTGSGAY